MQVTHEEEGEEDLCHRLWLGMVWRVEVSPLYHCFSLPLSLLEGVLQGVSLCGGASCGGQLLYRVQFPSQFHRTLVGKSVLCLLTLM